MALTGPTLLTADPDTSNVSSYASPSVSPPANSLVVVGVWNTDASNSIRPTLSSAFSTGGWTDEGSIQAVTTLARRLTIFSAECTGSPGSGAITADFGGDAQTGCIITAVYFEGHDSTTPIPQFNSTEGGGGSATSLTVTLGTFVSSANINLTFVGHNVVEDQTASGGGTEVTSSDVSYASPNAQMGAYYAVNDVTIGASWSTSAAKLAAAVEIAEDPGGGPFTIDPAGTITPAGALAKVGTFLRSFGGTITPAGALDLQGETQIAVPASDVSDDTTGLVGLTITPFSGSSTYAEAVASEPSDINNYTNRHIEVEYALSTGTAEVIMQLEPLDEPAAGDCTLTAWHNTPVDGDVQLLNGDDGSVVATMGLLPVSDDYEDFWTIQDEVFTPGDLEPVHDWADLQIRFYQGDDGGEFVGSGGLTYVQLEAPATGGFTANLGGTLTPAGALAKVGTFARPFAGTITPAGALAKVATLFRSFGGTITPAGTVATPKTAPRSFAGTITPAGALSKVGTFLRSLGGTITPGGFLDRVFTPGGGGGTNYNISPHGTITPAGALAKVGTFFRSFAGTITPAATLTKVATLFRSYAGTITPAGALSKPVSRFRSYAGTITPAGSLARVRNYARSLTGTITPTGAYTRVVTWFRTFTGTITPRSTLTRYLNGVLVFFGLIDHTPDALTLVDHTNDTLEFSYEDFTVELTVSGNEITDASRALGVQGDGLSDDSSYGIWEATTNLCTNGGFETNMTGWSASSATFVRSTADKKFGTASGLITFNGGIGGWVVSGPIAVTAELPYTLSYWLKRLSGSSTAVYVLVNFYTAGDVFVTNHFSIVNPSTDFVRYSATGTPPATTTKAYVYVYDPAPVAGDSYYLDGVQYEQQPIVTPYVETNGGTATRAASAVTLPTTLVTTNQGWIAYRLRPGWGSAQEPYGSGGRPYLLYLHDTAKTTRGFYDENSNALCLERSDGTNVAGNYATVWTVVEGQEYTVIYTWTLDAIRVSLDGGAFYSVANNNVPHGAVAVMDVCGTGSTQTWDGDLLWLATGSGTLTSADAAAIHAFGDTDPRPAHFSDDADCTMVWRAEDANAGIPTVLMLTDHVPTTD